MGATLSACAGDMDPSGPDPISSEALVLEPENPGSQGGFDIAAPTFMAAIELRTHAMDSGQLATARVAIVDEGGEPVSGVAVYGTFTVGVQVDVQSYTDVNGVTYFESAMADGAQAGFEVDLVSYEIAGELAYVPPRNLHTDALDTFIAHAIEGDGVAEGVGTSTGSQETNVVEDPPVGGGGSGGGSDPNASSRTADETTTDQGVGTSTGIAPEEETESPTNNGVGTSTGSTTLN